MNRYDRHLAEREETLRKTPLREGGLKFFFHEDDLGYLETGESMGYFEMPPLNWEAALTPYCTRFEAEVTETGYKMKNSRTGYMMHFPNSNRDAVIEFSKDCHARALERFMQSVMDELGLSPEELENDEGFNRLVVSGSGIDIYPKFASGQEVALLMSYKSWGFQLTVGDEYIRSSDDVRELIREAREITSEQVHSL